MNRLQLLYLPVLGIFLMLGITIAVQNPNEVDSDRLMNADGSDGEWLTVGLDYHETRYSPLDQINTTNVDQLALVWSAPLADPAGRQEATPLMHNGMLYAITNWSVTIAWDGVTGEESWRYDPDVDRSINQSGTSRLCCGVVNRGLGLYEGKIFVPIIDGRIAALDAETGEVLWSIVAVPSDSESYSLTMAPRVVKDKVIVGFAGAEFPPFRGYFSAYDVDSGDEVWRFWTVPGNPADGFENDALERAAETWTGEWWEYGGGGSVWEAMAYDAGTNLLYVGIGNPTPWPQVIRQGPDTPRLDNLYVSSIVAVDVDTGEYAWHYQTTPGGDDWDFDAVQHLMLLDLEIDGRMRQIIVQANKNGIFYVLDRGTGAFISAEPYAQVSWTFGYDYETGRPNINPDAYYSYAQPVIIKPSGGGAHSWAQMAYNPNTGYVYIPGRDNSTLTYATTPRFEFTPGNQNLGLNIPGMGAQPPGPDDPEPAEPRTLPEIGPNRGLAGRGGFLSAWNPVTQTEAWFSNGGAHSGGGVLSTAGNLVLQMLNDGTLRALNAETGELLADIDFGQLNMGPPITYMVDGVQYIAGMGGGVGFGPGGGGQQTPMMYVFALNGGE